MVNKGLLRIINGLEVYCSNKEKGCQWKGELKNMSTHLNKGKREGECQYEEVKCQYEECQERKQRRYLKDHDKECPQRPFGCLYCRSKGTFLSITKDHYEKCLLYPVTCPNICVSTNMPRGSLTAHVNRECPLEPVDCVFSWAGCNDKPLRKDVHVHTADTKHMTLLAVACGQLKKENEQIEEAVDKLKSENERVTKEVETLKIENALLKDYVHNAVIGDDSYPLLPVDVPKESEAVHFYTSVCGRHMSARLMDDGEDYFALLAFHEGKFDKFKPKLPKVFTKYDGKDIPLIKDTEATYEKLPADILNGIQWSNDDTVVPQGVIKVELGISLFWFDSEVTIYTQL
uniref:TRAF-type domain-containing protein n=1 Tax=Amphimedon queenslandica TaxID=400682 RepID=A0A1X7SYF0_AMPQE